MVVTILQDMSVSNQHFVHLKLTQLCWLHLNKAEQNKKIQFKMKNKTQKNPTQKSNTLPPKISMSLFSELCLKGLLLREVFSDYPT